MSAADDPIALTKYLSSRLGGKLSSRKAFDANVCAWVKSAEKPWEFTVTAGEPFLCQLHFSRGKRKVRVHANHTYLLAEIRGDFPIDPLGIDAKDKIWPIMMDAGIHEVGNKRHRIFARQDKLSPAQLALLRNPELVSLVEDVRHGDGDMVQVNRGSLGIYLVKPDPERLLRVIEKGVRLADDIEIEGVSDQAGNFKNLPRQFHPIVPLIRKWAIDDDVDREARLAESSRQTLEALANEVSPYLRAIDSYLDSQSEQLSTEATALGRLAECAIEAKHLLARRP